MNKPSETWQEARMQRADKFSSALLFLVSLIFMVVGVMAFISSEASAETKHRDRCAAMGQAPATLWPSAWICVPVSEGGK